MSFPTIRIFKQGSLQVTTFHGITEISGFSSIEEATRFSFDLSNQLKTLQIKSKNTSHVGDHLFIELDENLLNKNETAKTIHTQASSLILHQNAYTRSSLKLPKTEPIQTLYNLPT